MVAVGEFGRCQTRTGCCLVFGGSASAPISSWPPRPPKMKCTGHRMYSTAAHQPLWDPLVIAPTFFLALVSRARIYPVPSTGQNCMYPASSLLTNCWHHQEEGGGPYIFVFCGRVSLAFFHSFFPHRLMADSHAVFWVHHACMRGAEYFCCCVPPASSVYW